MGRVLTVEKHEFGAEGTWVSRAFTGPLMLVAGESGAGKSTGLESQWYALGLSGMKIMPAVQSYQQVRLTFRVDAVRWRATRSAQHSGGSVEFENLSDSNQRPVQCPVSGGKNGELSAAEFVQDLLGIPRVGTGASRLGMEQVLPWLYLRQATIATSYLAGNSATQRKLTGRTLLGAHDAQVEMLRARAADTRKRWNATKALLEKLTAARKDQGLAEHEDLQAIHAKWTAQHSETAQAARKGSDELGRLNSQKQALESQVKGAEAAQKAARDSADSAEKDARICSRAEGEAEGLLKAWRERAAGPTACPQCHQRLVTEGLAEDVCPTCKETDPGRAGRGRAQADRVTEASQQLDHARAALRRSDDAAAAARLKAFEADQAVREAHTRTAHFVESSLEPQRKKVADLEAAARELAARLEQLAEHLKETDVLGNLKRDLKRYAGEKDSAKEEFEAAEKDVDEHVKALVTRWSHFFEVRMKATDPRVRSASIAPEDFSPVVNGRPFDAQAVAGAVLTSINVNAALSLRDLAREVPAVVLPGFLMIDSPLSGLGTHGHDQKVGELLLQSLTDSANRPDDRGEVQQIIAAVNAPLPAPVSGVREIVVDKDKRYIPGRTADGA